MRRAHALQRWECIKAYGEGKNIQGSIDGKTWHDYPSPNWEADDVQYRIKVEPREFWIGTCDTSGNHPVVSENKDSFTRMCDSCKIIHVREVID